MGGEKDGRMEGWKDGRGEGGGMEGGRDGRMEGGRMEGGTPIPAHKRQFSDFPRPML